MPLTTASLRLCCRLLFLFPSVFTVFVAAGPRSSDASANDSKSNYEIPDHHGSPRSTIEEILGYPFNATSIWNALQELHHGLETMQAEYFDLGLGKWTTAIDWTSAVMGSHVSTALNSLSHSVAYTMPGTFDKDRKLDVEAQRVENEINRYFSHSIAFYFGEEAFSIRQQAYDDMLWVVLGWLESIRFIEGHSEQHYPPQGQTPPKDSKWHALQFNPSFAHRARIFYELAVEGWDSSLCGGGMVWNPRLEPYKNAITNELFIAASTAMYLNFPGDDNCSPFAGAKDNNKHQSKNVLPGHKSDDGFACGKKKGSSIYDPLYLDWAVNAYKWLNTSGMKNEQGLYVDGFHVKNFREHKNTRCDQRTETVWTYNQGVILSGLRGLWEGTGNIAYLEEGHELIRSVIRATGWTSTKLSPKPAKSQHPLKSDESWAGLGAHGILTELCDPSGTCNQDAQTFKGIYFQHMTAFCAPLPTTAVAPGKTHGASRQTATLHRASCDEYAPWVVKNAQAALNTRDSYGRFGMWWGAGDPEASKQELYVKLKLRDGGFGNDLGRANQALKERELTDSDFDSNSDTDTDTDSDSNNENGTPLLQKEHSSSYSSLYAARTFFEARINGDLNDRGRGRTVETQSGGVAVTRAMWEFLRNLENVGSGRL